MAAHRKHSDFNDVIIEYLNVGQFPQLASDISMYVYMVCRSASTSDQDRRHVHRPDRLQSFDGSFQQWIIGNNLRLRSFPASSMKSASMACIAPLRNAISVCKKMDKLINMFFNYLSTKEKIPVCHLSNDGVVGDPANSI